MRQFGFLAAGIILQSTWTFAAAPKKVELCHRDGKSGFYSAIMISIRAMETHHAHHGDCLVDDGVACTRDRCDRVLGCVHETENSLCDDGLFCNGVETCTRDGCAAISSCPPVAGCISVTCDEENDRCVRTPDDARCDNEDACDGRETCDPQTGECTAGTPVLCDDENECTIDRCDPDDGCLSSPRCLTDADCGDDPCIVASCTEEGCCVAVDRCPPTFGTCVFFTGQCDPDDGTCLLGHAPIGAPCDTSTGSILCGANGCDGSCQEDGCVRASTCGNEVDEPGEECEIGQFCVVSNQFCNPDCTCPRATCTDGIRNGDESDVDCGGLCACCEAGHDCFDYSDCCDEFCEDGECSTVLPIGSPCTDGVQCESGVCVDGVCCNNDCFGTCIECNQPGSVGICADARPGTDPHEDCPGSTCNGAGGCSGTLPGGAPCTSASQCASGVCFDGECL